jgi:enoyl-CoA hydratase
MTKGGNAMNDHGLFKVEKQGFVTSLVLNRPEKRNAMNIQVFENLRDHFDRFDEDPEVRVVVIKAEGKSFTAGLDLSSLAGLLQSATADARETLRQTIRQGQESLSAVAQCRKPVIAAVHGHCIGAGVDLLCACDIRLATRDAVFSVRETRMAMVADLGTLQRLPPIIGDSWFRELALTGRDFDAEEALKIHFITHIYEDHASLQRGAGNLANEIATCSPLAVQGVKDVMRFNREHGLQAGLEYVAQKNAAILISDDLMEAVQAFMEKRPPQFKGT